MLKGISPLISPELLKILNEMDELTGVESQMFTILNDLQLGINELCILYEKIEKLEK